MQLSLECDNNINDLQVCQPIARNVPICKDNARGDEKEVWHSTDACVNLAAWASASSTAAGAALPLDAEPGTHPDAVAPVTPNMLVIHALCLPFPCETCAPQASCK